MTKHIASSHVQVSADHPVNRAVLTGFIPRSQAGLERIAFFSDAVIAIAITLLALEIRLPDQVTSLSNLTAVLLALTPRYLSFFISFFVIGLFWMSYHRVFEYIHTYDSGLIWINLVFLFLVAFVPFPTIVLGRFPAELPSVVLYAAIMVSLSLVRIWFWWYVYYRAKLVRPQTDPRAGRYEFLRALWTAGIFGISIVIAFWSPGWAMGCWSLLLPITIMIRSK